MTRRRVIDPGIRKAWGPGEVAGMLGVSYSTVLDLIHSGELSAIRLGRYWVVPVAEVDRYLEARLDEARRLKAVRSA